MTYSKGGPVFRTRYRNRDTGERTAEVRANLHVEGDLDVEGAITQDGEALELGGATYKTYVALLSQSGTNAPVATVLENTLGGTVVWSRTGPGRYVATLADAFTVGKTSVLMTGNNVGTVGAVYSYIPAANANEVSLRVMDSTFEVADDLMNKATIEIRVYP